MSERRSRGQIRAGKDRDARAVGSLLERPVGTGPGGRPTYTFVADEMVAAAVMEVLRDRGHRVHDSKSLIGDGQPDDAVAKYAASIRATVITFNVRHYRGILCGRQLATAHSRPVRYRDAGGLFLHCYEPVAPKVLSRFVEVIESELAVADEHGWVLQADVHEHYLQIAR